jgi:hypothetical protein
MRTRVTQLPRDCSGGEEAAASTGALVTAAAGSATSAQHSG